MPRPPRPNQKRYRGRIRSDMRSSIAHLKKLTAWNIRYNAAPLASYPNQLASAADMTTIGAGLTKLQDLFAALGPIPSR